MPYLNYGEFEKEKIKCTNCDWEGMGSELQIEDYHESDSIIDFCCPKCFEHVAYTQPPMRSKKNKKSL